MHDFHFAVGGTCGSGRMCYVTFGLLSVSAESKTSAYGRPLYSKVGVGASAALKHGRSMRPGKKRGETKVMHIVMKLRKGKTEGKW